MINNTNNSYIGCTAENLNKLILIHNVTLSPERLLQKIKRLGIVRVEYVKVNGKNKKYWVINEEAEWFGLNLSTGDGDETVPYFWDGRFPIILEGVRQVMKKELTDYVNSARIFH